jgi:stage II sporulation protein M
MITMPVEEIQSYLRRLRPYLTASLILFGVGFVIGLMLVNRFPQMADAFQESLGGFVKIFRGLPKGRLAAMIFLNNTVKTLLAILLGTFFGLLPAFFLVVNGAALGAVLSMSTRSRGLWVSLLSVVPHGILELPAVFLGSAIGIMIGTIIMRKLIAKSDAKIGAELGHAMKFFVTLIVPLLFVAALVEAFLTSALVTH